MNRLLLLILCAAILPFGFPAYGQTLSGVVTDLQEKPVEGASIILQTADSTYLQTALSDADGHFVLQNPPPAYRLLVQHLLYLPQSLAGEGAAFLRIRLQPQTYALDEATVKADRPFVRLEEGRLAYDLSALTRNQAVNNAYEALAKLPGVRDDQGTLKLAGTDGVTVILNGKPTTMDARQLETLLRNTPVDRVEKAEVMYSTPPEYHVRGAAINLVLKRTGDHTFQGEVSTDYTNQYFSYGNVNGNFRYSTPRLSVDVLYGANLKHQLEDIDLYSRHTLAGQVYDIRENEQLRSKARTHSLHTGLAYNLNAHNQLSLSYTGNYSPDQQGNSWTAGNFQTGNLDKHVDDRMHNVTLHFHSDKGIDFGGDYTHFDSDNRQHMFIDYAEGHSNGFALTGGQRIRRWSVYADRKHTWDKGWNLGYGASFRRANDRDWQTYHETTGEITTQDTDSDLNEQTANAYVSAGKNYENGTSWSVSATGEYYAIGNYHRWSVFPQASLSYQHTPNHLFQLSLSTDKTYPNYWSMQASVTHLNGYSELQGTPGLRPVTTYELNANYIWKQKYIFGLFFTHAADYFIQVPYQATDRLALIYKEMNWNYQRMWGANVILPFKAGRWLDTRLTLVGLRMHQRCDHFYDVPFDRRKWAFNASLNATFRVNGHWAFELQGDVQTPAIQGTFDIGSISCLTAGMKWNFGRDDRFTLSARCFDIFNSAMPSLKVRHQNQYLDMGKSRYSRNVSLHFSYRFGGYKKKEVREVDTSRFGH